jgi:hypothetical protein
MVDIHVQSHAVPTDRKAGGRTTQRTQTRIHFATMKEDCNEVNVYAYT